MSGNRTAQGGARGPKDHHYFYLNDLPAPVRERSNSKQFISKIGNKLEIEAEIGWKDKGINKSFFTVNFYSLNRLDDPFFYDKVISVNYFLK